MPAAKNPPPDPRPHPPPLDSPEHERQLDRYYMVGLVCMVVLVLAFPLYKSSEPERRARTTEAMLAQNVAQGTAMFAQHCAACHGDEARGGRGFPTLSAKEFLASVSDTQLRWLISGGVPGTGMTPYALDLGGPFTDQEINWLVAYLRSLEVGAPSVPNWFKGLSVAPMRTVPPPVMADEDESETGGELAAGGDVADQRTGDSANTTPAVPEASSSPAAASPAVAVEEIFTARCAMCHGPAGEGSPIAPAVRPLRAALRAKPDSAYHVISRGVPGSAMMPFGVEHGGTLDATAIRALVQWLTDGADP